MARPPRGPNPFAVEPGEGRLGGAGFDVPPSAPKKQQGKKATPKRVAGGGKPALTAAQLAAVNAQTGSLKPAGNVRPSTQKEQDAVVANVLANQFLKGIAPTLQESAANAPGAFTSGVNFIGPNLYRILGGDSQAPGIQKHGSPGWAALEAAGILPVGKFGRGVGVGIEALSRIGKGGKAVEDASQVERAVRGAGIRGKFPSQAEASSHLPSVDNPHPAKPGLGSDVRSKLPTSAPHLPAVSTPFDFANAIKGMPEAISAQEKAYSVERGIRAQGAMKAYNEAGGGTEGVRAALGELKGALPVINHDGFTELTPEAVDHMTRQIMDHPGLGFWESIRAVKGLDRAVSGRSVQRSQLALLEKVFGKETADALVAPENRALLTQLYDGGLKLWNVPRTLMASFDLSAPFRQGLVAGSRHPIIFAKNFKPMVKAFGSDRVSQEILNEIPTRENFPRYGTAKLQLTDIHGTGAMREEQFPGSYVDNLPGVRGSGRAYSAFLNRMRVDVFDRMIDVAAKQGKNIDDPKFLKALGEYINTSTGRGKIPGKHGEDAAQFLNTFLFSPRLLASRFQILNPVYYGRLFRQDPFVARQAMYAAMSTIGGIGTMVYLASNIPGARVGLNPLSADFGKTRIGNTRVDFAGGFQPLIVLYSRLWAKKSVSSSTGKTQDINGGYGTSTRPDVVYRFFQSKLSPTARLIWDRAAGQTYTGDPVTVKQELGSLAPLNAQGAYDAYMTDGKDAAIAAGLLGSVGFGVGSYPDQKPASKSKNPFAPAGGGSAKNPFAAGGSPSSSNPFASP